MGRSRAFRCTTVSSSTATAALARRALALSLAEPSGFEVTLRFENAELDLGPKEWPANGDFLLARVGAGGELVDLTDDDIRLWLFWLGLDHILNR